MAIKCFCHSPCLARLDCHPASIVPINTSMSNPPLWPGNHCVIYALVAFAFNLAFASRPTLIRSRMFSRSLSNLILVMTTLDG